MHIVLIGRYYPPDLGGGLALYAQTIAREFVRQGHKVTVLAAASKGQAPHTLDQGVRVQRIPQWKVNTRSITGATCLMNSVRIAQAIEQLHQEQPIDVIQCPATFFETWAYGRFFKRRLNIPLVVKFHENRETYERVEGRFKQLKTARRNWLKQLMRDTAHQADYWLGVSQGSLDGMLAYLDLDPALRPGEASPSPINTRLLQPTHPEEDYWERFSLPPDAPFLFYSGRLIYEKGLHLLADAFLNDLSARFPDWHLAVAGEFDYRQPHYEQQIRQQLAGHPAASRVHFLGRIPYEAMPYWYTRCGVFVGPSFCEPFGRVFIEAMVCEAPVVAFNSGGPTEFIRHGENGILAAETTAACLADELAGLMGQPGRRARIARAGRETAIEAFSQERIARELLAVYSRLLPPGKIRMTALWQDSAVPGLQLR